MVKKKESKLNKLQLDQVLDCVKDYVYSMFWRTIYFIIAFIVLMLGLITIGIASELTEFKVVVVTFSGVLVVACGVIAMLDAMGVDING